MKLPTKKSCRDRADRLFAPLRRISPWIKQTLSGLVGTSIGIALTFGTTALVERQHKKEAGKIAAMMVIRNIQDFKESLEDDRTDMETIAKAIRHIEARYPDDAGTISKDTAELFREWMDTRNIGVSDHTVENVFGSSESIWESISNPKLVENAGRCFSLMRFVEAAQKELEDNKYALNKDILTRNGDQNTANPAVYINLCFKHPDFKFFLREFRETYMPVYEDVPPILDYAETTFMEMAGISQDDLEQFAKDYDSEEQ